MTAHRSSRLTVGMPRTKTCQVAADDLQVESAIGKLTIRDICLVSVKRSETD